MTKYESIPQLVYPKGSFTKAYDTILITGEVFRAQTMPNHLGPKDKAYQVSIKITPESFKELRQPMADDRRMTGLKKVELKKKVLDEEGNPKRDADNNFIFEEDEMGDPIKEFSHLQVTVKQNKEIKGEPVTIPVLMADDNSIVTDMLAEGSKVTVLAQCYNTVYQDKPAMGMNLKEVRVHELVTLEGGGGGADPWAAIGMTAAPKQEPVKPKQEEPTKSETPDFSEDDDDMDQIPF